MEKLYQSDLFLQRVELGAAGREYMRKSLAIGKGLSRVLLHRLDLDAGRVITFLPHRVTFAEATDFLSGGKVTTEEPSFTPIRARDGSRLERIVSLQPVLVQLIERHLASDTSALCVIEDAIAIPSDKWIRQTQIRLLLSDDSVYYVLLTGDSGETINKAVTKATSIRPPLIGILGKGSVPISRNIQTHELEELAKSTSAIIAGAYDGEGFVIWIRDVLTEKPSH